MGDLWLDEGFGSGGGVGEDDWGDGEESIELSLEKGFDEPLELDEDDGRAEDEA